MSSASQILAADPTVRGARPQVPWLLWLRRMTATSLLASVLAAVVGTRHWPIVGDAPLFHYIVFLTDHGKVPYRDIIDINMPGTYALEWAAIHLLGPGAVAWRVFDVGLVAVCAAAMLAIAWPIDRLAGWFGGALFALLHVRDGPTHTGQRDLMMTALLLVACAAMFWAVRRRSVAGAAMFGLFAGAASTVKPSGVLFAAAFAGLFWWRGRELAARALSGPVFRATEERSTPASAGPGLAGLATAAVGFAFPVLACGVWLWRHGALRAFVDLNRGLVAYHASLGRPSLPALVVGSFPSVMLAVALPAAAIFFAAHLWRSWGAAVLLSGAAIGAASYVLQGKGFPYHRYPAEAFLAVGCGLVLLPRMRSTGTPWLRGVAVAGVLLGALYLAPASAAIACRYDWRNQEFNRELAGDLNALGGSADLQGTIQCVDMTSGCLNTLYNVQIVQATGFLYDCYLFQPTQTPVSLRYREDFWRALTAARPRVLVVTDQQCFALTRDWNGPARWPPLAALLAAEYVLQKQYTPPHLVAWWRKPAVPYSYRLYVRKDDAPSTPASQPARHE